MRCPTCGNIQQFKVGIICTRCSYRFHLNHKVFPFISDRKAHGVVRRVSASGERPFTAHQVVAALIQSRKVTLGLTRKGADSRAGAVLQVMSRYLDARKPPGYLDEPMFDSMIAPDWPEPDTLDYGAERILVVDRRLAVDLLVRLWVHTGAKAIIVSADRYPKAVAERAEALIGQRPDVPVFTFTGSGTEGAVFAQTVRSRFGVESDRPIIDLGLERGFAKRRNRFAWARKLSDVSILALSHRVLSVSLVDALLASERADLGRDGGDAGGGGVVFCAESDSHDGDDFG